MSSWKTAMLKARKESAKPPPGSSSLDQIAEDMGMSTDHARKEVAKLIKLGRAELIRGQTVTATGALINMNYYRLIPESQLREKALKKKKKR
jgi:hypothetical protein